MVADHDYLFFFILFFFIIFKDVPRLKFLFPKTGEII